MQKLSSDINKSKCGFSVNVAVASGTTEIVWKVTSCSKIFKVGSLCLIHGRITISPANHDTPGPQRGSFMVRRSRNGNRVDRVPFYGFMGNVCCRLALRLRFHRKLMVLLFYSRRREDYTIVRQPFDSLS